MNAPARFVRRLRRIVPCVLCVLCATLPWPGLQRPGHVNAAEAPLEQVPLEQVKAAYLLKFPGFVEWPPHVFASSTSPLVIAVAGADDVYTELRELAPTHPVRGRPVEVLRLQYPEPTTATHLVFVGNDRATQLPAWVAAYADRPVVVVADAARGLESGAALNFIEVGNRLRFEASPGAAERSGLRLSSRLLGVAERVLKGLAS